MTSDLHSFDRSLSVDTAGESISCAVVVAGAICSKSATRSESRNRNIAVLTNELLEEANVTFPDLGGVIISLGPGSFTGMRVGLSFAKGIVAARSIPLVGVTRFEQVIYQIKKAGEAMPDSMFVYMKSDSYYRYSMVASKDSRIDTVSTVDIVNLPSKKLDNSVGKTRYCFVDCEVPKTVANNLGDDEAFSLSATTEALFGAAREKLEKGKLKSWLDVEPLYIQRSAAEIRAMSAKIDDQNANSKNA